MIDVLAVDDLPDPELLGDGDENTARALARRLLQPRDANEEIGDLEPIETMDLREYLGASLTPEEILEVEARAERCLFDDERVRAATVRATFGAQILIVTATCEGAEGPFGFVLSIDRATSAVLFEAT